jgi:hypothetical protein
VVRGRDVRIHGGNSGLFSGFRPFVSVLESPSVGPPWEVAPSGRWGYRSPSPASVEISSYPPISALGGAFADQRAIRGPEYRPRNTAGPGRPLAPYIEEADAYLPRALATPEDLSWYERRRGPVAYDHGGGGAYSVIRAPVKGADGKWRNADGTRREMVIDPAAPTGEMQVQDPNTGEWRGYNPAMPGFDTRANDVRELTLGQVAQRAMKEAETRVIGHEGLENAMGAGRFQPLEAPGPGGEVGYLRVSRVVRPPAVTAANAQASPEAKIRPTQRREGVQMSYEMVPVYETTSLGSDGLPLYRVARSADDSVGHLPRDVNQVAAEIRSLLPDTGATVTSGIESVQANRKLPRITPVRLNEAVNKRGFQLGEADPATGAVPFTRPDGSGGLLVPEVILKKGDRLTNVPTGRYVVATEADLAPRGSLYGPGPLLEPGTRAWLEKQRDLNPEGLSVWDVVGNLRASGGAQPVDVDGRRLVAQLAAREGIPLEALVGTATAENVFRHSRSQLIDLQDAARALQGRQQQYQPGLPGIPAGLSGRAALRASSTPEQRNLDARYGSPMSALPNAGLVGEFADNIAFPRAPLGTPHEQLSIPLPAPVSSPAPLPAIDVDAPRMPGGAYSSGYRVIDTDSRPEARLVAPLADVVARLTPDRRQAEMIADVALQDVGAAGRGVDPAAAVMRAREIAAAPVRRYYAGQSRPAATAGDGISNQQAATAAAQLGAAMAPAPSAATWGQPAIPGLPADSRAYADMGAPAFGRREERWRALGAIRQRQRDLAAVRGLGFGGLAPTSSRMAAQLALPGL